MSLPIIDEVEVQAVEAEQIKEDRKQALATVAKAAPVSDRENSLMQAAGVTSAVSGSEDPMAFLKEQGIDVDDVVLNFTSFPMITLADSKFSCPEGKIADEFEVIIINRRKQFLFKADLGRDKDPILMYSSDKIHDADGLLMADHIAGWESRMKGKGGAEDILGWDMKEYTILMCQMLSEPYKDEIVQIQVSPSSGGVLNGYYVGLAVKKLKVSEVITKVSSGKSVGSGVKAFTPFTFKAVKV